MKRYPAKLLKLRHRISKPALRLFLIWLALLATMFAAPRWIDHYFTNHAKVLAGVNYYPYPIQIQFGNVTKQVAPFDTYRWDSWDTGEVELVASRMSGEEIGRRSWQMGSTATSYLDFWSPNDTVASCAAHLDLTDLLFTGGEHNTHLVSVITNTPQSRISYTYPSAPQFQILLDKVPVLPESTGTSVSVSGVFPVPCNVELDNQYLNEVAEYWLDYKYEFAYGIYQQQLASNTVNLTYGTL